MRELEVVRAEEEWQRAGAYSVRIQGMNRQHHISLREEFDEHDGDDAKYIILLDDGYPVATCRIYPIDGGCAKIGRVVVLPEYRGKHLGSKVIREAERWIDECGFQEVSIDARDVTVGFYEKLGYKPVDGGVFKSGPFDCVRMLKQLPAKSEKEEAAAISPILGGYDGFPEEGPELIAEGSEGAEAIAESQAVQTVDKRE